MSEEFWFPAGDWKDKVTLEAARADDGTLDDELVASWFEREHKAIFSYNPLDIVGPDTLFVVLQVYRIAHDGANSAYLKSKRSTKSTDDSKTTADKANKVFAKFGTHLLTPLCFGVSRFLSIPEHGSDDESPEAMQWPQGQVRHVQLYVSGSPESQEAFVERLRDVVAPNADAGGPVVDTSVPIDEVRSDDTTDSKESWETTKKKSLAKRIFRSPKPSKSRSPMPTPVPPPVPMRRTMAEPIQGSARLFLSSLKTDFLQSMLVSPSILEDKGRMERSKRLPKLFVDVSGDFAVVLDRHQTEQIVEPGADVVKKRSDLLRLPPAIEPAGYVGTSEFREILYLPARPDKRYDVDSPLSCRSLLNLLYLYPRLLRLSPDTKSRKISSFTIRIRVIHTQITVDEETGEAVSRSYPLHLFHNPSPWAGPDLLNAVYTKVVASPGSTIDSKAGIPIKDEVKVRLPKILDGSYSLEFKLYSVESSPSAGMALLPVSETSIPLSSSSPRDGGSGSRVATVIPNGKHRLELRDFQLQLETRLVS
jgi:hypothetical protein